MADFEPLKSQTLISRKISMTERNVKFPHCVPIFFVDLNFFFQLFFLLFYRYMNSPQGRYRGCFQCVVETAKNEGFRAFYKGFTASFTRLVAWNICLWLSYEQLKKQIKSFY